MAEINELKCNRYCGSIYINVNSTIDQLLSLDEEPALICTRMMKAYVLKRYKLSITEYYNIVVFNDVNHKQNCRHEKCNNTIYHIQKLSYGYKQYCNECIDSKSWIQDNGSKCMTKGNKNPANIQKYLENISDDERNRRKNLANSNNTNSTIQAKQFKSIWLKKARSRNYENGYLYIVKLNHQFKIGISFYSIGHLKTRLYRAKCIGSNLIYSSDIETIADLECYIKSNFNHQFEWFDNIDFLKIKELIEQKLTLNFTNLHYKNGRNKKNVGNSLDRTI